MSGELDAIGTIATGAVLASVVEPHVDGTGPGAAIAPSSVTIGQANQSSKDCLNCGTPLTSAFCGACGQKAKVHRTLAAFWHDLVHSVFHFDGKIWRTLPMLAFKPGHLTRRYVHGERAKFVSPLALFLFTIFLMVATFGALSIAPSDIDLTDTADTTELVEARTIINRKIAALEAEKARRIATQAPLNGIDGEIGSKKQALDGMEIGTKFARTGKIAGKADTGWTRLDTAVNHAMENPSLFFYKMQSNAYKYSWALILMSVPFLWLMFAWRRQFKLFDHAVFVTYSMCFMTILFTIAAILGQFSAMETLVGLAICCIPPVHIYKHIRYAYGTSRVGAATRMALTISFALVALTLFAVLVLAIGVA